jgi:drug/metabolite transporter (DMT)-like permease
MSQLKKALIWVLKGFLGYAAIATPMFAILYWALRIPAKQLLPPYFLLFGSAIVGALMMFDARRYVDQPNSFRIRFSVATFVCLILSLAVIYYFGHLYGLVRPEYPNMLIATGLIGVGGVSIGMFFYLRRWLDLRTSKK